MKFTLSWLKQYLEFPKTIESASKESLKSPANKLNKPSPNLDELNDNLGNSLDKLIEVLNNIGLEVENVRALGPGFIIVKIIATGKHPKADKLSICKVSNGQSEFQIVCGASNARAGLLTVMACVAAVLPNSELVIKKAKIRGVESFGMLCSTQELGILASPSLGEGIIELTEGPEYSLGQPFVIDPLIELSITPNRGDCLSIYGIARDLAAAGFGKLIKSVSPAFPKNKSNSKISLNIKDYEKCQKFVGLSIENITNCESPWWLREKLEAIGEKSISAVVDIANYIMFTYGTPMHIYDLDKISGEQLIIEAYRRQQGQAEKIKNEVPDNKPEALRKFLALNNIEYVIPEGAIIIRDATNIQCIAGIIGSKQSECSLQTKNIFLECANFNHIDIALTKRALQINTESSYRFERQIDNNQIENSLSLAAELITQICGGSTSSIVKDEGKKEEPQKILFEPKLFQRLTGIPVIFNNLNIKNDINNNTASEGCLNLHNNIHNNVKEGDKNEEGITEACMLQILINLGFEVKIATEPTSMKWQVTVPSWRHYIENPSNIVEEILRIYGFNNLKNSAFRPFYSDLLVLNEETAAQRIRKLALGRGFKEVISWSFMDEKNIRAQAENDLLIKITNPIIKNLNIMRPNIVSNLWEIAHYNINNGTKNIMIFEIGRIYHNKGLEENVFSALRVGDSALKNIYNSGHVMDVFDAKADILAILRLFNIANSDYCLDDNELPNYYHPKRSGRVLKKSMHSGEPKIIAYFGELNNGEIKGERRVAICEFFIDRACSIFKPKEERSEKKQTKQLIKFPSTERDFAFVFALESMTNSRNSTIQEKNNNNRTINITNDSINNINKNANNTNDKNNNDKKANNRTSFPKLAEIINQIKGCHPLIQEVELFDRYTDDALYKGKLSLAFRVVLQNKEKTLENLEIENCSDSIINIVKQQFGGILRRDYEGEL